MKTFLSLIFLISNPAFAAVSPAKLSIQEQGLYGDLVRTAFSRDKDMPSRWKALMSAAQLGREKATPDLLKASRHQDWFMRSASMIALADYNPAEGVRVAKRLIKDKALVVRSSAVDLLAKNLDSEGRALF